MFRLPSSTLEGVGTSAAHAHRRKKLSAFLAHDCACYCKSRRYHFENLGFERVLARQAEQKPGLSLRGSPTAIRVAARFSRRRSERENRTSSGGVFPNPISG